MELTVTDKQGCQDSIVSYVPFSGEANFTYNRHCYNVRLADASPVAYGKYRWVIGTDTLWGDSVQYTFSGAGDREICMTGYTASNEVCDVVCQQIKVPQRYEVEGTIWKPSGDSVRDTTVVYALRLDTVNREVKQAFSDTLLNRGGYSMTVPCHVYWLLADPLAQRYDTLMKTYYKRALWWRQADPVPVTPYNSVKDIRLIKNEGEKGTDTSYNVIKGKVVAGSGTTYKRGNTSLNGLSCGIVSKRGDSVYQREKTNDSGQLRFDNLPEGSYYLRVDAPGIPVDTTGLNSFNIPSDNIRYDSVIVRVDTSRVWVVSKEVDSLTSIAPSSGAGLQVKKVYPNPAGDQLNIRVNNSSRSDREVVITLQSIQGKRLLYREHRLIGSEAGEIGISLERIPSGTLLLQVKVKGTSLTFQRKVLHVE